MTETKTKTRPRELEPKEVSERYNGKPSVRTLANWRSQGKGPKYIRRGGKILYPENLLDEWDAKCVFQSTSNYRAA